MTVYEKLYHGIGRAAWAYLFLYFNINLGNVSILPTFVGYLLFLSAIGLLEEEERELSLLRPLALLLTAWHGLSWFLSFIGIPLYGEILFLDLVRDLVHLYFHFQLLTNLAAIAVRYQSEGADQDRKLLKYRTLQTIMITGFMMLSRFSDRFGETWEFISMAMGVVYVIAGFCLMRALFRLRQCLCFETE